MRDQFAGEGKDELTKVRLSKRLRAIGLENFEEYVAPVERDEQELAVMIDSLTTNKTSFFRELATRAGDLGFKIVFVVGEPKSFELKRFWESQVTKSATTLEEANLVNS